MNPILVTGGRGQLGTALSQAADGKGCPLVVLDRRSLDLCSQEDVSRVIAGKKWRAVINAAAYTAVDAAEAHPIEAWTVNALGPLALAQCCREAQIPLVHVSTDYVFSGAKAGAWDVTDPTEPLGMYGASKLAGELAIRTSGARHAIVRTSWLVSASGTNFLKTMLQAAADRPKLRVVDDQVGSPTSASELAKALLVVAGGLADIPDARTGVFHFANEGVVSWADFAIEIFRQSALRGGPTASVERIPSSEYPTPARRPANSWLNCDVIKQHYGIASRLWTDAIADILDELIGTTK